MEYYSTMVPTPEEMRQFKVYLPAALIRELKYLAIEEEQSLSALVAEAVKKHITERRRGRKKEGKRDGS